MEEKDHITFRELVNRLFSAWTLIKRKKKQIGAVGFLVAIIFGWIAFSSHPKYTAQISFLIEGEKSGLSGGGNLQSYLALAQKIGISSGGDGGGTEGILSKSNLKEIITSKSIIAKVLEKKISKQNAPNDSVYLVELLLQTYPEWIDQRRAQSFYQTIGKPLGTDLLRDSTFLNIYANLSDKKRPIVELTESDVSQSILKLNVVTENDYLSYVLAKYLLAEVSAFYIHINTQHIRSQIEYVEKQIAVISTSYTDHLRSTFSSSLPGTNIGLYRIDPQLIKDQENLHQQQALYSELLSKLLTLQLQEKKETPIFFILDDTFLPLSSEHKSVKFYMVLGFFAGICLAGFYFMAFHYFRSAYYHS